MAIENFNEDRQRAKVAAGFKGGPFYNNPMVMPKMNIVDGITPEIKQTFQQKGVENGSVQDPWGKRRGN